MQGKLSRFIIIIFILAVCGYVIYPTIQFHFLMPKEEKEIYDKKPEELSEMRKNLDKSLQKFRDFVSGKVGLRKERVFIQKDGKTIFDIQKNTKKIVIDLTDPDMLVKKIFKNQAQEKKEQFLKLAKEVKRIDGELLKINDFKQLRTKIIKLGLDLAGGAHLTYKVDKESIKKNWNERYAVKLQYDNLKKEVEEKNENKKLSEEELKKEIDKLKQQTEEERVSGLKSELDGATERVMTIIRSRINKFGVSEVTITRGLGETIYIELPKISEQAVETTKKAITEAGELNFHIVAEKQMASQMLPVGYHEFPGSKYPNIKVTSKEEVIAYFKKKHKIDLYDPEDEKSSLVGKEFGIYPHKEPDQYGTPILKSYLILINKVGVSGKHLSDAQVGYDSQYGNRPEVDFQFDSAGGAKNSQLTEKHTHERLAIVLDKVVMSAPVIQGRIGSRGRITMGQTSDLSEVKKLVAILKAGVLPGVLIPQGEMTLEASLGAANIDAGLNAVVIGLAVVMLFMLVYYRVGGFLAVIALCLNLFMLISVLSAWNFTLTLPGIAGVVLTVGMAVDANVIIFERMREETKAGKTVRAVIDGGYGKAFSAIFDSNLTTIMAAFILTQIGSGIIKGFGFTLMWGIMSSMFTALFVTRFVFDCLVDGFKLKKVYV